MVFGAPCLSPCFMVTFCICISEGLASLSIWFSFLGSTLTRPVLFQYYSFLLPFGNSRYPRDTDRRFQCCGAHFRKPVAIGRRGEGGHPVVSLIWLSSRVYAWRSCCLLFRLLWIEAMI
ncbi:hypothetical protein N656DRAFT_310864 [Canariomyces notabilis]|uniref:Uncharacterized protein n=1 Tax=Canariomyces notabilis TaxID=2074819 RepID=A0AAN6QGR8_9PEZI|nr:hypothetical protein N656DRAFT_310864 [Canariomyces arenarius]